LLEKKSAKYLAVVQLNSKKHDAGGNDEFTKIKAINDAEHIWLPSVEV
jgi:hypothetical protein